MLVLGIDTATRVGTVGLVRAPLDRTTGGTPEPGRVTHGCEVLAERSHEAGTAHATELPGMMDECLAAAGAALEDVGCIAVSAGPGSFTGLRVALATAKGLALAGGVPIVGVSTLEALAATVVAAWRAPSSFLESPCSALIVPCLDARKGEVYAATFAVRDPVWEDVDPALARLSGDAAHAPGALAAALAARAGEGEQVLLLGDGPERYRAGILDALGPGAVALASARHHASGAVVARLGAGVLARSGPHDLATLVPFYARASEAEIARRRTAAADGRR